MLLKNRSKLLNNIDTLLKLLKNNDSTIKYNKIYTKDIIYFLSNSNNMINIENENILLEYLFKCHEQDDIEEVMSLLIYKANNLNIIFKIKENFIINNVFSFILDNFLLFKSKIDFSVIDYSNLPIKVFLKNCFQSYVFKSFILHKNMDTFIDFDNNGNFSMSISGLFSFECIEESDFHLTYIKYSRKFSEIINNEYPNIEITYTNVGFDYVSYDIKNKVEFSSDFSYYLKRLIYNFKIIKGIYYKIIDEYHDKLGIEN